MRTDHVGHHQTNDADIPAADDVSDKASPTEKEDPTMGRCQYFYLNYFNNKSGQSQI